jgi:putative ABC transport system substrate-binding protein
MTVTLGRRELLVALGGAVAWPLAARAQQDALPVIGFLNGASAWEYSRPVAAFRQSLSEGGSVENKNLSSNTAGPRVTTIDCRCWPPIWFAARWL